MSEARPMLEESDIIGCDKEPIHTPGAILPHGALLVLDADTFEILQAAGDLRGLLGTSAAAILGRPGDTLFNSVQVNRIREISAGFDLATPRHLLDPVLRVLPDHPLDVSMHRVMDTLVLEFEAAETTERFAADPLAGVQEMIRGFDSTTSLHALCSLAAERVRNVALYDRVLVYRFMHDDSGWVIAESREKHLEPFLDLHYPAADIPAQARKLYMKNWLRLITEVNYEPAKLVPANNPRTGEPLDMSQAVLRDVSPVHRQYLRNMGIDASMSISIICGGKLWGLIACHNYSPRRLPRHLRAVCELFGSMFSLQLEAREKGEQFEARLASRMVLQNLMLNLATADDYGIGLTQQSPNLLDYIHGGDASLDGANRGGVAVSVKGQLNYLGITPSQTQIEQLILWLNTQMAETDGVFFSDRLGEIWAPAHAFAAVGSGILVISVSPDLSDYIIWFRPELVTNVQWAGAPAKRVESGPHGSRLMPRESFEAWKETVVGRSAAWTRGDTDAASDLRISLLHVVLRRINIAARERRKAAERDKLLMAELDHRVKNTLANIQALVVQTSRNADSLTGFVEGLDGRLQSMAKAHSLLSQSRWEGVSIEKLMHEELDPYGRADFEIVVRGPDLVLTSKSALSLSLVIHELATNAAKFGALSTSGGRVSVRWVMTEDKALNLTWTETGGPAVAPPGRRGFGSTLIERALSMETGGHANVAYLPGGVVCNVFLPASSIASIGASHPETLRAALPGHIAAIGSAQSTYRILLVEDSFLLVMAVEDLFDNLGWKIVGPATRLADAMFLARTETFDAALLDVNLNGEMSWDAADVLADRDVPFLFSTGYDAQTVLPPRFAGRPIICKPFETTKLESRLRQVITDHRSGR